MTVDFHAYFEVRGKNILSPSCQSYDAEWDDKYHSYQLYFCKQSERDFNDKTAGTIQIIGYSNKLVFFMLIMIGSV